MRQKREFKSYVDALLLYGLGGLSVLLDLLFKDLAARLIVFLRQVFERTDAR